MLNTKYIWIQIWKQGKRREGQSNMEETVFDVKDFEDKNRVFSPLTIPEGALVVIIQFIDRWNNWAYYRELKASVADQPLSLDIPFRASLSFFGNIFFKSFESPVMLRLNSLGSGKYSSSVVSI